MPVPKIVEVAGKVRFGVVPPEEIIGYVPVTAVTPIDDVEVHVGSPALVHMRTCPAVPVPYSVEVAGNESVPVVVIGPPIIGYVVAMFVTVPDVNAVIQVVRQKLVAETAVVLARGKNDAMRVEVAT